MITHHEMISDFLLLQNFYRVIIKVYQNILWTEEGGAVPTQEMWKQFLRKCEQEHEIFITYVSIFYSFLFFPSCFCCCSQPRPPFNSVSVVASEATTTFLHVGNLETSETIPSSVPPSIAQTFSELRWSLPDKKAAELVQHSSSFSMAQLNDSCCFSFVPKNQFVATEVP